MLRSALFIAISFPVISILGILANITVVALMLRKVLRSSTTSLYLSCLAVADSFILITGCVKRCLYYTMDFSFTFSEAACKASVYIPNCVELVEIWILVTITLKRLVAVTKPHKVKMWFTLKRGSCGILITVVACFVITASTLPLMHVQESPDGKLKCILKPANTTMNKLVGITMAVTKWFIPYAMIIASNAAIIAKMKKRFTPKEGATHMERIRLAESRSLTRTLVLTTSAAVALTVPKIVFRLVAQQIKLNLFTASDDVMWWVFIVLESLYYVNSAVNIVFYVVTGTCYQKELDAMLSCCRKTK